MTAASVTRGLLRPETAAELTTAEVISLTGTDLLETLINNLKAEFGPAAVMKVGPPHARWINQHATGMVITVRGAEPYPRAELTYAMQRLTVCDTPAPHQSAETFSLYADDRLHRQLMDSPLLGRA